MDFFKQQNQMNVIETLKQRWDFVRILRLVIGVTVIGQAFIMHEWLLGIGGGMLTTMALLNIGCCGAQGCAVSPRKDAVKPGLEETRFEEVNPS
jgi:hypothetical protein